MEYNESFERTFIARTLEIVEQYEKYVMFHVSGNQQFEVTLLVNCLLGLLVLPKEWFYHSIPTKPIDELQDWGLLPDFIQHWGDSKKPQNLREFVLRLRNAVAHGRLNLNGDGDQITTLKFTDQNGFDAVVPVGNLKTFVTKFALSVNARG